MASHRIPWLQAGAVEDRRIYHLPCPDGVAKKNILTVQRMVKMALLSNLPSVQRNLLMVLHRTTLTLTMTQSMSISWGAPHRPPSVTGRVPSCPPVSVLTRPHWGPSQQVSLDNSTRNFCHLSCELCCNKTQPGCEQCYNKTQPGCEQGCNKTQPGCPVSIQLSRRRRWLRPSSHCQQSSSFFAMDVAARLQHHLSCCTSHKYSPDSATYCLLPHKVQRSSVTPLSSHNIPMLVVGGAEQHSRDSVPGQCLTWPYLCSESTGRWSVQKRQHIVPGQCLTWPNLCSESTSRWSVQKRQHIVPGQCLTWPYLCSQSTGRWSVQKRHLHSAFPYLLQPSGSVSSRLYDCVCVCGGGRVYECVCT